MDYCVCCGNYVAEGDLVCITCKRKAGMLIENINMPKQIFTIRKTKENDNFTNRKSSKKFDIFHI